MRAAVAAVGTVLSVLSGAAAAEQSTNSARGLLSNIQACQDITRKVSNASTVFYPGAISYFDDVYHQSASSSEVATCSVEPGTAEDVGVILRAIGENLTPFAVKGGGHVMNAGFSSTTGIQIAMSRFKEVSYDAARGTVSLGAGLTCDEVHAALDPLNATFVGARATGVGIAGLILGGGFSFLSNQHGLAADNVVEFELVLTNGTIKSVTAADTDLFWALKGGGNNFGVVTQFVVKAYPYTQIWGGLMTVVGQREKVVQAILNFTSAVTDPKAAILPSFIDLAGVPTVGLILFYDGPLPPPGIFDEFLALTSITNSIKTGTWSDLMATTELSPTKNLRGAYHTLTVKDNDRKFLDAILAESANVSLSLLPITGTFTGYHIEPFVAGYLLNPNRTSDSAFPYNRDIGMPVNVFYSWILPTSDQLMLKALKASVKRLDAVAGTQLPRYPNYALGDTPLVDIFGADGVERLQRTASVVDAMKTMGRTGGFKF
ncbi:FAD-binding domain-containing protein [Auriculariales sp. MPI-PUGE-AT-0066]|nr:FAD-binding domain-containing protein [Auriculariales sp. MPI-PUGE-AT-0066]